MKRAGLALLMAGALHAAPAFTDQNAVKALIGEAGNQSDRTLLAVAGALRNRGTLAGVYGGSNPTVVQASAQLWARAARAWRQSATVRLTRAKFFGSPADARYFRKTLHYTPVGTAGDITFYRP